MYRIFNDGDISGDIGIVTSGIWQDGASSLETFFSSSTQYANTGDYSVDVYRMHLHLFNLEWRTVTEMEVAH